MAGMLRLDVLLLPTQPWRSRFCWAWALRRRANLKAPAGSSLSGTELQALQYKRNTTLRSFKKA